MDPSAIDAVLFDMDGTLVDSDGAVERAWTAWAAEYGVDAAAVLAVAHGSPADRTVRLVRPDLGEAEVMDAAARQLAMQYEDLRDVVPAPGAHELLAMLNRRRTPWAIVTSADARLAAARLEVAGVAPPVLVTVDDVRNGKPDPEGYRLAATRLGVDPARCLVVEDAEPGLEAGRAAGALTAALRGLDGDLRLEDLDQLARLFT
jgi:HAD superfamily hydrolase (TIGR01509 family)